MSPTRSIFSFRDKSRPECIGEGDMLSSYSCRMEQASLAAAVGVGIALIMLVLKRAGFGGLRPPRPGWRLPVIGHLHLLGRHPHKSLMQLAESYGPLVQLDFGSKTTLVVSSAEVAKEVVRTNDLVFASRPKTYNSELMGYQGAGVVWSPYGEHWRNVKKLCTVELLIAKRVEYFRPVRASEMQIFLGSLVDAAERKAVVNLTKKLSELNFNIMCKMVLNKSYSGCKMEGGAKDAITFRNLILEGFEVGGNFFVGDFVPWLRWMDFFNILKMNDMHKRMDTFLQHQIDEHREHYQENDLKDFIDVMLSLSRREAENPFSDTTMKAVTLDMIGAGTESSSLGVEWALAELVRQPILLRTAQAEVDEIVGKHRLVSEDDIPKLEFLQAIVKEALRLHPPFPLLAPHESIQPCQLQGYHIPVGTRVLINAYALGRDPSVWKDPLDFRPARFLNTEIDVRGQDYGLLPFGSGRRSCPGLGFAMTTMLIVVATLIHGFDWETQAGEELDMSEGCGFSLPKAVPLQFIPSMRLPKDAYSILRVNPVLSNQL